MLHSFALVCYLLPSKNTTHIINNMTCQSGSDRRYITYISTLRLYTGLFISPLNMSINWLMPQLNEDSNDYIFQQDGCPTHHKYVRRYLNRNLPQRWTGRTGKEDDAVMRWPPRSPCDFFCGFVKDTVFVPPLPANLQIFTTASPLLWLWSTVICWHACGTRWTIP